MPCPRPTISQNPKGGGGAGGVAYKDQARPPPPPPGPGPEPTAAALWHGVGKLKIGQRVLRLDRN